ncbi:peptidoglycan-binding domain-containing protein [Streptomyces neyagawaensis]|uniref:Peptidoglycan-binding protein n=1 Tax=Streptomyces neyagawaensis TaxID=42238 RepID=A0ABV3AV33_9ACTN
MRLRIHRSERRGVAAIAVLAAAGMLLTGAPTASAAPSEPHCEYIDDSARPTVRPGDVSPAVRQVQCLVNQYSGYPRWLEEDGTYGPRTEDAVRWVQNCNGTTGGPDGIVGPSTWSRLYTPKPECAFQRPATEGAEQADHTERTGRSAR